MALKVAINGFGRIGRMVLRALCARGFFGSEIEVVAIAEVAPQIDYLAYQLKYDSVRGRLPCKVLGCGEFILVDEYKVKVVTAASPEQLPWRSLEVDAVIESTGIFTDSTQASGHLQSGAKKVIITAPAQGDVKTIVMGVNECEYDKTRHHLLSAASCTVNCLAMPVWALLKEGIGIESGLVTAINSYTASQRIVDGVAVRGGWRCGRAAGVNIIPSTTSAQKLAWEVLPQLKGKLAGVSYRVPTIDGSLVDLTFRSARDSSVEEIDAAMKHAGETYLQGYLGYTDEELVSSDFINDRHSAIYDSLATLSGNLSGEKRFFKVVCWYDNEWGYANRVVDLLRFL